MTEPMSSATHWDTAYRDRASDASSWWQSSDELWLDLLDVAGTTAESQVVDVGAGASLVADALLARGVGHVTLLDLSDAALTTVRERIGPNTSVSYVVGDVRTFVADPAVDVWHDRAVLHFLVDQDDRSAYRDAVVASLKVGGHVVIAVFAEDGPHECSGLPVLRNSVNELAAFLGSEFEIRYSERRLHTTPWGSAQPFTVVVAERVA